MHRRVYSESISMGSFWIGVKQIDGVWLKTNGEILSKYEVQLINEDTDGNCIIADKDSDYKHKIVDCNLQFSVSKGGEQ